MQCSPFHMQCFVCKNSVYMQCSLFHMQCFKPLESVFPLALESDNDNLYINLLF